MTRGLGLGWWSVAYDSLPLARDAAEDRRNVHLASDFDCAMRSLGFCIAVAGALTHSWDLGWARGEAATDPKVSIEEWRAKWQPNLDGRAAP